MRPLVTAWKVGPWTGTPDDLRRLIADVVSDTFPPDLAAAIVDRNQRDPGYLATLLGERMWFETRLDGELVGAASVQLLDDTTAYLGMHFVRERRQGIGRAQTSARLDWARARGATAAVTTVDPWNEPSLHNLARFGFDVVDEQPDRRYPGQSLLYLRAALDAEEATR